MQPRQRSKCCDDGRVQRDRAVESRVDQVDPPARRVHLLAPQHVRRAGRKAEAAVDAVRRVLADHAASTPRDRARRRSGRRVAADAGLVTLCHLVARRVRDAGGEADDGLASLRERRGELARGEARHGRSAVACRDARLVPDAASASSPPTSACAARDLGRDGTLRALEQHGDAAGMEDVERARLELRAEKRRGDVAATSSVSTTSVRVALGSGCRRKLTRAMNASRPSDPHTSRARS